MSRTCGDDSDEGPQYMDFQINQWKGGRGMDSIIKLRSSLIIMGCVCVFSVFLFGIFRLLIKASPYRLLQRIRDEAHRFAITFHRSRRSKRTITTELTEIKGIGKATAYMLLSELGSVEKIKNSNTETLSKIIGNKKAQLVREYFTNEKNE